MAGILFGRSIFNFNAYNNPHDEFPKWRDNRENVAEIHISWQWWNTVSSYLLLCIRSLLKSINFALPSPILDELNDATQFRNSQSVSLHALRENLAPYYAIALPGLPACKGKIHTSLIALTWCWLDWIGRFPLLFNKNSFSQLLKQIKNRKCSLYKGCKF